MKQNSLNLTNALSSNILSNFNIYVYKIKKYIYIRKSCAYNVSTVFILFLQYFYKYEGFKQKALSKNSEKSI